MGKLNVTNGDWSVTEPKTKNGSFYRVSGPSEKVCNVVTRDMVRALSNAKIIADAGTTYNKSALTASELLQQRDELLKNLMNAIDYMPLGKREEAKMLIQKIENHV